MLPILRPTESLVIKLDGMANVISDESRSMQHFAAARIVEWLIDNAAGSDAYVWVSGYWFSAEVVNAPAPAPVPCERHTGMRTGTCRNGIVTGGSFGAIACQIVGSDATEKGL